MTDDHETVIEQVEEDVEATDVSASPEPSDAPSDAAEETTSADAQSAGAGAGQAADGSGAEPPEAGTKEADGGETVRRRFPIQALGTLLILVGVAVIGLTVGVTAWRQHQHDAETKAFLSRVSTPGSRATTPFPSTVSGVLVPDTARTPTANAATRAAQPVATTSDGSNHTLLAPAPVAQPTAAPPVGGTPAAPAPPKPPMPKPTHIDIPAIKVDSEIVEVGISPIEVEGQQAYIWDVAPYAVGHHFSSADPGEGENVVLSGHDDWQGEVFKNLYKLQKGDEVALKAGDRTIKYHVDEILLLPEVGESLEKRLQNAAFIGTTGDERLTLVTCWPYGVDDHRLVVIARPDAGQ